jgi:hypothetical protein
MILKLDYKQSGEAQGHALRGVVVSVFQTLLSFAQNYMPN